MRTDVAAEFGLDPAITHLNHGAFGCAPAQVRAAQRGWQERAEANPHRFNRVELPALIARARAAATDFLGVEDGAGALVRNVSEGISAVLASLDLRDGDEVVVNNHGYGAVRIAVQHWVARRGARLVESRFDLGAPETDVVAAYASCVTSRTRLVIVDHVTSPTATVLPVAAVARAVDAPVLVDAAHVPGALRTDIAGLG
ncbi:MAG: aminotransferase class V-fold PLP-dependent enzyme, partial [Nocardioidaceae bacterium]